MQVSRESVSFEHHNGRRKPIPNDMFQPSVASPPPHHPATEGVLSNCWEIKAKTERDHPLLFQPLLSPPSSFQA